jgi:hypothetical protein
MRLKKHLSIEHAIAQQYGGNRIEEINALVAVRTRKRGTKELWSTAWIFGRPNVWLGSG